MSQLWKGYWLNSWRTVIHSLVSNVLASNKLFLFGHSLLIRSSRVAVMRVLMSAAQRGALQCTLDVR